MPIVTIKPIRNTADLQAAKSCLARLLSQSNNTENDDDIEVLTTLIEQFEERNASVDLPDPVAAIKFRMEEKGLSPRQLEPFIGSRARVSEVLSGKRSLSIDMIRSLHEGLGIPYESLMARPGSADDIGNISDDAIRRLNQLGFGLDRSEIPSFISSSLRNSSAFALHRKTNTQRAASKTDPGTLLLWQAAVLRKSEATKVDRAFEQSKLTKTELRQIAKLSSKIDGPRHALGAILELGIATIIMPLLPGTFLDGAAMLSARGVPVIGLTLRYDRIDNFWFTLLHELCHLYLHYEVLLDTHVAFVDDMDIRSDDAREQQADALARETLIPAIILEQVVWGPASGYDDLVSISTRARVPLAVAAGRWQRDHQNYKKFSRLIDRSSVRALLAPNIP
jgi:HTH-type transcriptional regulator/antitoxin HigA